MHFSFTRIDVQLIKKVEVIMGHTVPAVTPLNIA